MRNYDLSLILSPSLSTEEANDLFQKFVSFVQELGGILQDQRLLGKKPLLAPIQDSKEGYLAIITFSLSEEKLPDLQAKCKENDRILRFFLIRQVKRTKKTKTRSIPTPEISTISLPKREEKADLKDIDEKLEEIFKES